MVEIKKKVKNRRFEIGISLVLITVLGIFLRSIPSLIYPIWSEDYGVYYAVTTAFISSNNIFGAIPSPWGTSGYGNFPMFYWIIDLIHFTTGINVHFLLLHIPPILGGLTVPILYFIAKKVTGSNAIALLSALFLAINPIDIFETSMVGLLVVGHVFLLLSILFFIYVRENKKYFILLILSSGSLILSHHISTFMYIISVLGIIFWTRLQSKTYLNFKYEISYLVLFTAATFLYWIIRSPTMEGFISGAVHGYLPWYLVIALFYLALYLIFLFADYIKILNIQITKYILKIKDYHYFLATTIILLIIAILGVIIGVNGPKISIISIIYSVPFILTLGFIGVGARHLYEYDKAYMFVTGWFLFLILGLLGSLFTFNTVLYPYRYLEYIFEPLSILAAIGLMALYHYTKEELKTTTKINIVNIKHIEKILTRTLTGGITSNFELSTVAVNKPHYIMTETRDHKKDVRILLVSIFSIIIMMSALMSYPIISNAEQVQAPQYISSATMSAITWLQNNGSKNYSNYSVATDFIDGVYLESLGFNSSFEYDNILWNATSWQQTYYELEGLNHTYNPILYVLIDSDMYYNGVYGYKYANNPYAPPIKMGKAGFDKFFYPPFQQIYYYNSTTSSQWVYLFQVNWTYIHANLY
ncbi:MAG: ArnT family glycosyltransferase [Thermoplasmata archaeon]